MRVVINLMPIKREVARLLLQEQETGIPNMISVGTTDAVSAAA